MFPIPVALWNAATPTVITPAAGQFLFTGQAPDIAGGNTYQPSAGALAFTGQAPIVTATENRTITPSAGALAFAGEVPPLIITGNKTSTPSAGSLAFAGQAPVVTKAAPLSFVVDGTLTNSAASATVTYTVVSAIPLGALIIVLGSKPKNGLSSVTDSKGNAYTVNQSASFSGASSAIASAPCTTALAPGDTITLTWGGSSTGAGAVVGWITPPHSAPAFDQTATANNSSASPFTVSATTPATTQASEVVVGVGTVDGGTSGISGGGYTTLLNASYASGTARVVAGYKIISSTGAQTFAITGQAGHKGSVCVATYKGG